MCCCCCCCWFFIFIFFKWNADGVVKGKTRSTGIGVVLYSASEDVLVAFPKSIGAKDSDEAEMLAIKEVWNIFAFSFSGIVIAGSRLFHAIRWVASSSRGPRRFCFIFNKIKAPSSSL